MGKYDPEMIEAHFDKAGLLEWDRLYTTPHGRVQLHIHNHYLKKHVKEGDRVLEIGPGPGRFTIELAKIGASIAVVDISREQLRLNEEKVIEAGFEGSVEWRKKLDILDLDGISDESFDSVVCYGGPLSYVLDFVDDALSEVLRVTKVGGKVLASVMSCLGTYRHLTNLVFDEVESGAFELDEFDNLTKTGDIVGRLASEGTHQCHMFRWSELRSILQKYPVTILDASATNFLSTGAENQEFLTKIMNDAKKWKVFLDWELDFAREPGAIDGASHMLVVFSRDS